MFLLPFQTKFPGSDLPMIVTFQWDYKWRPRYLHKLLFLGEHSALIQFLVLNWLYFVPLDFIGCHSGKVNLNTKWLGIKILRYMWLC